MVMTVEKAKMGPVAAMVFGIFWIALGIWSVSSGNTLLGVAQAALGIGLLVYAVVLYRRRRAAPDSSD